MTGPAGEKCKVYTVLADSDTFGTSPKLLEDTDEGEGGVCCGGTRPRGRASRLALRPAAIVSRGMMTPDRLALSLAGNPTTA